MSHFVSLVLLFLSFSVNATQCVDGKKTIKEWTKEDGVYLDYNLPKAVINSGACFLKPYEGEILQPSKEIHSFISQNMSVDYNRKINVSELPKLLVALGNEYNVYLLKPCEIFPIPNQTCEQSDSVILGYVAESLNQVGKKAYVSIDTSQYLN